MSAIACLAPKLSGPQKEHKNMKIWMLEDDPAQADLLGGWLREAGHDLAAAKLTRFLN